MKLLILAILLISSFASAGIEIGEKFLLPNTLYVNAGASIATSSIGQGTNIFSRTNTGAKTFYLNSFSIEGYYNVINASAARLGSCSLQIPAGTTVATYNFVNSTTSGVDRVVFSAAWPTVITSSFAINCVGLTSTTTNWSANYNGWEY